MSSCFTRNGRDSSRTLDSNADEKQNLSPNVFCTETTTATGTRETPKWETLSPSILDQGPLFVSCVALDNKSRQLFAVVSLEKNRFCELVRYDLRSCRWSGCTRTRHFRPPKRVGSAAAIIGGRLFVFGGYELSNQLINNNGSRKQENIANQSTLNNSSPTILAAHVHEIQPICVFGHPPWWLDWMIAKDEKSTSSQHHLLPPSMIGALGDFHSYDTVRGEWNVIISRENKPPPPPPLDYVPKDTGSEGWRKRLPGYHSSVAGISNTHNPNLRHIPHHIPLPRAYHSLSRLDDFLLLFGGERWVEGDPATGSAPFFQYFNDVWAYDTKSSSWTQMWTEPTVPSYSLKPKPYLSELRPIDSYSDSTRLGYSQSAGIGDPASSNSISITSEWPVVGYGDVHRTNSLCALTTDDEDLKFPLPRSGHSVICRGKQAFMFGGQNSSLGRCFGDTWQFDIKKRTWQQCITVGDSPGCRFGHTAVLTRGVMTVYGGLGSNNADQENMDSTAARHFWNAVFFLDLDTFRWTEIHPLGSPPRDAQIFGRLHGFFWDGHIWFAGATGKDSSSGFQMTRVDMSDVFPIICCGSSSWGGSQSSRIGPRTVSLSSTSTSFRSITRGDSMIQQQDHNSGYFMASCPWNEDPCSFGRHSNELFQGRASTDSAAFAVHSDMSEQSFSSSGWRKSNTWRSDMKLLARESHSRNKIKTSVGSTESCNSHLSCSGFAPDRRGSLTIYQAGSFETLQQLGSLGNELPTATPAPLVATRLSGHSLSTPSILENTVWTCIRGQTSGPISHPDGSEETSPSDVRYDKGDLRPCDSYPSPSCRLTASATEDSPFCSSWTPEVHADDSGQRNSSKKDRHSSNKGNLCAISDNSNSQRNGAGTCVSSKSMLFAISSEQGRLQENEELQAEVNKQKEENNLLKGAILLLVPFLKVDDLASALNAAQSEKEDQAAHHQTRNNANSTGNAIVDSLLSHSHPTILESTVHALP